MNNYFWFEMSLSDEGVALYKEKLISLGFNFLNNWGTVTIKADTQDGASEELTKLLKQADLDFVPNTNL